MGNILADQIEQFIMKKFWQEREREIIVQRKEIADALQCAPSQISYVLNTRFSTDKGFIVESKRGLGGFIRITLMRNEPQEKLITLADVDRSLYENLRRGVITQREAQLVHEMFAVIFQEVVAEDQPRLLHTLQDRLGKVLRGGKHEL